MNTKANMRVLMVTSEWPTPERPEQVPFIVQQVEFLRKAGIDIEVFHFRGNKNPINYLKARYKLRRTYDMKRFDLIHIQFGQAGLVVLPTKLPVVVTFWGSDLHGIVGGHGRYTVVGAVLRLISRFVARCADEVIVVSEHLKRFLPKQSPFHVITHGVDFDLFHPIPQSQARKHLGLSSDKLFIVFAADPCNPVKRFHLASKAVELLKGQADLNVELITLSKVPHKRVPIYMNACNALLLTSLHEGSPTVVKEALACNLPVISVDVGDVRQRLDSVEGCVICEDDNPETIAAELAEILSRNQRIDGRAAVSDLDERLLVQKIISVYEQAISDA